MSERSSIIDNKTHDAFVRKMRNKKIRVERTTDTTVGTDSTGVVVFKALKSPSGWITTFADSDGFRWNWND